jgi:hypothetical protein
VNFIDYAMIDIPALIVGAISCGIEKLIWAFVLLLFSAWLGYVIVSLFGMFIG